MTKKAMENARETGTLVSIPYYSEVFDWLLEKGIIITIRAYYFLNGERGAWQPHYNHWGLKRCESWHEAANAAIEKALTLIQVL